MDGFGFLCLYAFEIIARTGVDANLVADIAEERNADGGAGLDFGRFEGVGGCIAFDTGLGVLDFKHSQVRTVSEAA